MRFNFLTFAFAGLVIETPICYSTSLTELEEFRSDRHFFIENKLGVGRMNAGSAKMIAMLGLLNDRDVDAKFLEFAKTAGTRENLWGTISLIIEKKFKPQLKRQILESLGTLMDVDLFREPFASGEEVEGAVYVASPHSGISPRMRSEDRGYRSGIRTELGLEDMNEIPIELMMAVVEGFRDDETVAMFKRCAKNAGKDKFKWMYLKATVLTPTMTNAMAKDLMSECSKKRMLPHPMSAAEGVVYVAPHEVTDESPSRDFKPLTAKDITDKFKSIAPHANLRQILAAVEKLNTWKNEADIALFLLCAEGADHAAQTQPERREWVWNYLLHPFELPGSTYQSLKEHMLKFFNAHPVPS